MSTPLDTDARARDVTNAVTWLAVTGGFEKVTLRNIAARVGISKGTLSNHLRNRAHILRVTCHLFAQARTENLRQRLLSGEVSALLPSSPSELFAERMWLAWKEQARTNEHLRKSVDDVELNEQWQLRRLLCPTETSASARDANGQALDAVCACYATLIGLRDAMCRNSGNALDLTQAQLALEAASAWARSSATMASGSSAE